MSWIKKNVYTLLIIGLVLFSLAPTFYELSRAKDVRPERQFELVHNYYTDYNFYLSRIKQGLEKNFTVQEKYTSEPHTGSFVQVFYLWLGWIGAYVRVPWDHPEVIYQAARIIFAITLLAMIAQFCKKIFVSSRFVLIAFLLVATASTWPKFVNWPTGSSISLFSGWRLGGYMPWWSVMDSLQRITFVPHLLAGQALMIFLVMALKESKQPIFLGILGLALGLIFPPGLLLVGAAGLIFALNDKIVLPRLIVGLISLPSLLYLSLMVSVYPWKRLAEFDVLHPLVFSLKEYLLAIGPVLPLGIIGLILALVKKEKTMQLAVAWILGWLILFVGFHFVPQQHPLRFSEAMPQVPLAVLAVYALSHLRNLGYLMITMVLLMNFGVMHSSYLWQKEFIDHKLRATYPLIPYGSYVMYPLKDFVAGLKFLQATTNRNSVVLSLMTTGNYIPAYAGNYVYLGHANTVKAEEKENLAKAFFSGQMSRESAKNWLNQARIDYIYYGPQEKEVGSIDDLRDNYQFLNEIYKNPSVTIYEIKK